MLLSDAAAFSPGDLSFHMCKTRGKMSCCFWWGNAWHVHLSVSVQNIGAFTVCLTRHSGASSLFWGFLRTFASTASKWMINGNVGKIGVEGDRKKRRIHNFYSTKPAKWLYRDDQNTNTHRWSHNSIFYKHTWICIDIWLKQNSDYSSITYRHKINDKIRPRQKWD